MRSIKLLTSSLLAASIALTSLPAFAADFNMEGYTMKDIGVIHSMSRDGFDKSEIESLNALVKNGSRIQKAYASLFLYKEDPLKYTRTVYKELSTKFHNTDDNQNYVVLNVQDVDGVIEAIKGEVGFPNHVIISLMAFEYYRDRNEWIESAQGEKYSVAAVMRVALTQSMTGDQVVAGKLAHGSEIVARIDKTPIVSPGYLQAKTLADQLESTIDGQRYGSHVFSGTHITDLKNSCIDKHKNVNQAIYAVVFKIDVEGKVSENWLRGDDTIALCIFDGIKPLNFPKPATDHYFSFEDVWVRD